MYSIIIGIFILLILIWIDFQIGKKHFKRKAPLVHFPLDPTKYELFTTGDTFFKQFFEDVKQAKTNVSIAFFTVRNDQISKDLFKLLKEKAQTGVTVNLQVDWVGSIALKRKLIKDLRASGVHVRKSNPPTFPFFFYRLNRRNHRKITIIDSTISYLGGFNVGKEYLGADPKLGDWRDYHLKLVDKQMAGILQNVFAYDWEAENKPALKKTPTKPLKGDTSFTVHITEAGQLEDLLVHWLQQAKQSISIGSPYFIPSKRVFDCLLQACAKGIDVTILVPEKEDHPLVKPTAFPYYRKLLAAGGKVHFYNNGFYHAKISLIDDNWANLGTANFDKRSFFLNQEINLEMSGDKELLLPIKNAFLKDLKSSFPATESYLNNQSLRAKIAGWIGKLVEPLL
ncbi:phospholipase D-like domain-containing protein [Paraliobacillus sediminis]|uniref:phospholipase D-like domain-containing protein n=1 Tax=Paraliobacillus sediminis TaxID=1885916 RepID=UPI000E3E5D27|nr:phospholipase D-like domain-containing protein [Paraliobacillus sediminis]